MDDECWQIERPTKRQKLDATIDPPAATSYPGYIIIGLHSFHITVDDTEIYKALLKCHQPIEVGLLPPYTGPRINLVQLKFLSLKRTTEPVIRGDASSESIRFLESCIKVSHLTNKKKPALDQPLAKCHAIVNLQNGQSVLNVSLHWHDSVHVPEKLDGQLRNVLFTELAPDSSSQKAQAESWDVKEFYDNVHVPSSVPSDSLKLDQLQCKLYPFQDRATRWMLSREGVKSESSGRVVAIAETNTTLPLDFCQVFDKFGLPCYYSQILSVVSSSRADIEAAYGSVRGGILAEAMGLGKTVETIALMCSHTLQHSPLKQTDSDTLASTGATLIITPPTILEQWKQEIREHAPSLRVFHYTGIKPSAKRKDDILETLREQDVVLTTYNVIASEIHYVREKPDRTLRNRLRREPPKSPLTQILWWRCLLDEAQMIESGVSNAAQVAQRIPRVNAWAVTGTPLKQSHHDLYGLLIFLRYEPWCQSSRVWEELVFYHRDLFRKLVSEIALRHSKDFVRDELRIPPQTRQVVTIPFTAIEESHYAQMHYDMQQDCGLDRLGAPLDGEWDPDDPNVVEKMRSWLQRLRQTCLHPEVGGRNRKALGKRGGGPLRTVAQVLDVMLEQIDSILHTELRNELMAKADIARHHEHARDSQTAQDMFKEAYTSASMMVNACRNSLTQELEKASNKDRPADLEDAGAGLDEDEDSDASVATARQRLRSALEIQHICIFFIGNTYYQLKEHEAMTLQNSQQVLNGNDSHGHDKHTDNTTTEQQVLSTADMGVSVTIDPAGEVAEPGARASDLEKREAEAYEEAKAIRTELLSEVHRKAQRRIKAIREKKDLSTFANIPSLEYSDEDYGGIESRKVFEKLYHYCNAMNAQAEQFSSIRERMTNMLCQVLIDEEETVELTGEEYEDSTKHQDEMYVVMEMLRALFADRSDAISGQENLLLKQETKQFERAAKEGEGPAPELMLKLLSERQESRIIPSEQGSLRGIMTEIRSLASSLEWQESSSTRAKAELVLVNQLLQHVQKLSAAQTKAISALEQEVNLFRDTMNARLDYYRALQVISDMVAPIGKDEDVGKPVDQTNINRIRVIQMTAAQKAEAAMSKKRYLLHLKKEQDSEGEARICTICQFEFAVGTLTICGHQFCKECIKLWWSEHRNCPVCKRRLQLSDFYDITYKPVVPLEEQADVEQSKQEPTISEPAQANTIYATIAPSVLQEIQAIDLRTVSYGSKVDTVVRHILHLRRTDPGSKSIIFSQFRDFLDVLSRSLRDNGIIHSKFDDKDGIVDFKTNPANECFLLHARAHAAGLNLVCASHVILCEPLINTAIELQAVARVHRIGQVRETSVWMYTIEGTVEEAIYDISVKRRLAHMDSKSREASRTTSRAITPIRGEQAIDAANAKELQAADLSKLFLAGKAGGEMVDKEDLWGCLFGNATSRDAITGGGPSRGLTDLDAASSAIEANSEIGRHLRAEAAESRRG